MSPDEGVTFAVSGFLALWGWWRWYAPLAQVRRLGAVSRGRILLALAPPVALVGLFGVLRTAASFDVRDSPLYLSFYLVMGAGWLALVAQLLPAVGLNPRDDVIERGNGAAAAAAAGALLGLMACFGGGNIGDGPGWWVVLFSAVLATAGLVLVWYLFDRVTRVADMVSIDRDHAAGLRLGALLAAIGLILGRAVAGDWVSAAATVSDFVRVAWPVLILAGAAALVERVARPTPETPVPPTAIYGVPPAALYVAVSVAYVMQLGPAA
jgi:uncharacterized membrane protein YjfL (UPF0719 family)